jgi:hypothetical protein
MGKHTSRRTLLGAIVIAPAAVAVAHAASMGALPHSDRLLFNQRLAAFESANAEFLRVCRSPGCPDEVSGPACEAAGDAYDALISTPAPDLRGLAAKLRALSDWSKDSVVPNDEVETIAADARRLLGREA